MKDALNKSNVIYLLNIDEINLINKKQLDEIKKQLDKIKKQLDEII